MVKDAGKGHESSNSMTAGETVHKQTFSIRDTPATNVTLYPNRASIVREIEGVLLKPGRNEITINDLTDLADEHSIKVEGRGEAIITDTTVSRVFNKFMPDDDDESDDETEEETEAEDESESEDDEEDEQVKGFEASMKSIQSKLDDKWESKKFATAQLDSIEKYGQTMTAEFTEPGLVEEYLEIYSKQREKLYKIHAASNAEIADLTKEMEDVKKSLARRNRQLAKAHKEKTKLKEKEKKEKAKLKAEKDKVKAHKAEEKQIKEGEKANRKWAWPKQCKKVKIMIEGTREEEASLKMNYIVHSASWTPRYDIRLDTISKTGHIIYKAEVMNMTFETWRDAQIKLSTSVTTFAGLSDKVPFLHPWHVGSGKKSVFNNDASNGLYSLHEMQANNIVIGNRKGGQNNKVWNAGTVPIVQKQQQQQQLQMQMMQQQQQMPQPAWQSAATSRFSANPGFSKPSGLFGNAAPPLGFGSSPAAGPSSNTFGAPAPTNSSTGGSLFGASSSDKEKKESKIGGMFSFGSRREEERGQENDESLPLEGGAAGAPDDDDGDDESEDDAATETSTLAAAIPSAMAVSQSRKDTHGLTTNYDIPGISTITHSSTARRYVISAIELGKVDFSSIVVPKLRVAAFLKARITNTSSTTLLRGAAGLTLDGSYLGNTIIPACNVDEAFSLSLGVDSGVTVSYSKPTRKTSSKGYINKEETTLYSRNITLANTKASGITIQILDQVPVSEDEKVKINIVTPKNLKSEGDSTKTGAAGTMLSAAAVARNSVLGRGDEWGSATATLKKDGQVVWIVKLDKGKNCKLALDYEVKSAPGEGIYGLDPVLKEGVFGRK